MSNVTTNILGFDALNSHVNIGLFNDIIGFVAGATTENTSSFLGELAVEHLWYSPTKGENISEHYGFRYFGELLERYEERFGSDIADIRAIALALAYSKDILADEMFVGRQKEDFLRKITKTAETDLYLRGALYRLNKDEADVQDLIDSFTQATYDRTEELIFVISLFGDFERAFVTFKPQLIRLLGLEKTITVNGNVEIFCWLIKLLRQASLENEKRKKDMAIFRAFIELPVSFVKSENRHHTTLLNCGYSAEDIVYLNSVVVRRRITRDTMYADSIVAEKIAIEFCTTFINSEKTLSEDVYEHLEWVLKKYEEFAIKISGFKGIYGAIKRTLKIVNPQTFLAVYRQVRPKGSRDAKLPDDVFLFDIMDEKWDVLCKGLTTKEYRYIFNNSLHSRCDELTREQVEEYISKYNTLTESQYLVTMFEKKHSYNRDRMFAMMVKKGIIDLNSAFQSCPNIESITEESKNNRPSMLLFIYEYVKGIHSRESFDFFRNFHEKHGFDEMHRLFKSQSYSSCRGDFFINQHYSRPNNYSSDGDKNHLKFRRDFLSDDEHREFFGWLDDYMFRYKADGYIDFTIAMLADDFVATLFPHDELKCLYDKVKALDNDIFKINRVNQRLRERFVTEAELQAEKDAEAARKAENKRLEKERVTQSLIDELEYGYDGTFKSIRNFMDKHNESWRNEDEALAMATERFESAVVEKGNVLGKGDINNFLSIGVKLVRKGNISFEHFKNLVSTIEEKKEANNLAENE
jgi:hypothetical protein